MTGPMLLGIDLGTSSVKVVLTNRAGRVLAHASQAYPVVRPRASWAETDPGVWWDAINSAVLNVAAQRSLDDVAGIGLSGQMHGIVLIDERRQSMRPAVLWLDGRATNEADKIAALPADVRRRLANPVSPGMAGPILAWLSRHERCTVDAATSAVQPKDWVRARVTGTIAGEASDASATLRFDVITADRDDDVSAAPGVPRRLLPPILRHSGVVAGGLDAELARLWGITAGVPVAAGAGDAAAAALGSGLIEPRMIQLTVGTGVQIVSPVAAPTPERLPGPAPVTHLYRSATPTG
jgi:xylulokinase